MVEAETLKSELSQFTGTGNYYPYLGGIKLTDGSRFFAEKTESFWLLDVIASYQFEEKLAEHQDFQVWKIKVDKGPGEGSNSAIVTCDDGNGNVIVQQEIGFTDFPLETATLWYQRGVIFLPSEY